MTDNHDHRVDRGDFSATDSGAGRGSGAWSEQRCVLAAAAAQNLSQRWGSDERGRHGYRIMGSLECASLDFLLVLIELFSLCYG